MKILRNIILVSSVVVLIGCGGGSSSPNSQQDIAAPDDLGELTKTEQLLYTDAYSGYLVVFLNESMGVRLSGQHRLISTKDYDSEIANVQQVLDAHPTATIKRSITTDPDKLDARRVELEALSGKELKDFNSIYHIYVNDPAEGIRLMRELDDLGVVEKVYPKRGYAPIALVNTPDLTPHQGYLYPESTHGGLNAVAAWNAGVRGEGTMLVDSEVAWNPYHEDLNINHADFMLNADYCLPGDTNLYCDLYVAHGTAMAGIMAAQDNGHGITGIAPNVDLRGSSDSVGGLADFLTLIINGASGVGDPEVPKGSIYTIIFGISGPNTPVDCVATPYGCLPIIADPEDFAAIEDVVAAGVTVVVGAANGEQDLDSPSSYYPEDYNLSQHASSAILVGGSNGASKQKAWFTNYGSPIDVFAWGENVATTSYPVPGESGWDWNGSIAPLPPLPMDTNAYFADAISGTSPATAQIGAVAALIQSYAKQVTGETTRYLTPAKMKEILIQSGVAQVGGGGNIGVQPRVDVAMGLVDTAWASWSAAYPELVSGQPFDSDSTAPAALRQSGLGIICVDGNPAASDPTCPDDSLYVPGSGIAKNMDFDGDGRADLVQWKRGQFKIDRASVGGEDDGFGSWDVVINYPQINSDVVWPYVEDMNSDRRTDLVLYDKEHGTWYIAYMNSAMLSGSGFGGWDNVVTTNIADTREMDPSQSMYCRPYPGDYDGDGWADFGVACSDGIWHVEYSPGISNPETSSVVNWPTNISYSDQEFQYLSAQQLIDAPGWAYITSAYDVNSDGDIDVFVKTPDGLPEEGRLKEYAAPNFSMDYFANKPHIFGGNDMVVLVGEFTSPNSFLSIGLKGSDGQWAVAEPDYFVLDSPQPENIWGDISCHPIAADYDGDGLEDRAVMCPDEWRISYSGEDYPQFKNNLPYFRAIDTLTYDSGEFTLPGRSYSGGVSYETTQEIIGWYQAHYPGEAPPIPVDMVSVSACELVSGSECY